MKINGKYDGSKTNTYLEQSGKTMCFENLRKFPDKQFWFDSRSGEGQSHFERRIAY